MRYQIDMVVTRHPGLVEYLRREGIVLEDVPVCPDAGAEEVRGRVVAGVLPLHLVAECRAFLHIPLHFPRDSNMRGKELTADQVAEYAGDPVWYRVQRLAVPDGASTTQAVAWIAWDDLAGASDHHPDRGWWELETPDEEWWYWPHETLARRAADAYRVAFGGECRVRQIGA